MMFVYKGALHPIRSIPVSYTHLGDREIAKKKFERDCKETGYKAALEAINVYKIQIKTLESTIEREWHSG